MEENGKTKTLSTSASKAIEQYVKDQVNQALTMLKGDISRMSNLLLEDQKQFANQLDQKYMVFKNECKF